MISHTLNVLKYVLPFVDNIISHSMYIICYIHTKLTNSKIKGLLSMGSWAFFQERFVAYSRFLSCGCVWCRTGVKDNMLNKCLNISTVGRLKANKMKPKVTAVDKPIATPSPTKQRRLNSNQ